jgi:hypothetical protein
MAIDGGSVGPAHPALPKSPVPTYKSRAMVVSHRINRKEMHIVLSALALSASCLTGCSPFDVKSAREVSRDRLLVISEKGQNDHLRYVGTEGAYHYVQDTRPDVQRV